ncbi:isopentenyl transferase family protein [Anabaena sp. FACHB-709]|uniref:Adenylate dimethylallyltransferase n=2 Tax=Nostocaceae TaxID=1162 RepID=A0A1Z4KQD0_ANAVA|nr:MULTISPECIES: tRNA (adenosine(37)-N6)-dimethylallyltransferase MiaA [Nostocaceae]BAY71191.1 isopentenyl transferase [Trichormus variabilis NIES-23]HBW32748.1 isopentenyl-diphosphate delta-isomerase [Nostoc sp. UBA8866]MBD2171987.1 isopentenyl-diphosphate delta-isomerase [Anabaena cylindrica FACHB-318]MBD2263565.1 isopentenyl-diphosphate delta-isomerase [Anabaena sp. FACHB-709]MBD2273109.1 isopentenyl-diphosphate delta-isomerase [Nostoc sp. PCC 7120 = FACHB-418]
MRLHIILGPTSVGKTDRSVVLAKQTKAPVIVLDRIQIYQEIATGSGRPLIDELEGTTRIYLEERQLADGNLNTLESLSLALQHIDRLSSQHKLLILEGGSISLCTALWKSRILENYQTTIEYVKVENEELYQSRLWRRMQNALISNPRRPSLIEELSRVWQDPHKLALVRTVVGYDVLIHWCQKYGLSPDQMWKSFQDNSFYINLMQEMFLAYMQYSQNQRQAFDQLAVEYKQQQALLASTVTL